MQLLHRPRRLRSQTFIRQLVRETQLSVNDLVYPVFVLPGHNIEKPIASMPGIKRYSLDRLLNHLQPLIKAGLNAIAIFPVIDNQQKTLDAAEAWNSQGLVQQTVKNIKKEFSQLGIITDVALDPYTSHGQDGILDSKGYVSNDETVSTLVRQALSHAEAGADIVAPSDMMDGRIGEIRKTLEQQGHVNTCILSYAAKYASSFYGPFRDAVGSAQSLGTADKTTYQMDPGNSREAMHEVTLDIAQGADMVMIKPAMPCLDIVCKVRESCVVPVLAYQVSGEYAMLIAAVEQNMIGDKAIYESLLSIKRAGADAIISYFSARMIDAKVL